MHFIYSQDMITQKIFLSVFFVKEKSARSQAHDNTNSTVEKFWLHFGLSSCLYGRGWMGEATELPSCDYCHNDLFLGISLWKWNFGRYPATKILISVQKLADNHILLAKPKHPRQAESKMFQSEPSQKIVTTELVLSNF